MGKHPREWNHEDGRRIVENLLAQQDARYVKYDQLLENAYKAYSDYLKKKQKIDHLSDVIGALDDYSEEESP